MPPGRRGRQIPQRTYASSDCTPGSIVAICCTTRSGEEAIADSVAAGEAESVLVALAQALEAGKAPSDVPGLTTQQSGSTPSLARLSLPLPDRTTLPSLDRYAHYVPGSDLQPGDQASEVHGASEEPVAYPAGYVEASRGCLHTCRHCPVVPVYRGRFFVVPVETVLADIAQQVEKGARHITFGDPDFLNGPGHARKVARALKDAFPQVSFDFTAKVEHSAGTSATLAGTRRMRGNFRRLGL